MSLLAEYDVSAPTLFLAPTVEALPALEVEIERQFALDAAHPIAFCWVRHQHVEWRAERNPLERIERALERDRTVAEFERIERVATRALYRIRRSDEGVLRTYERWMALGAELLRCRGNADRWVVEMRFPDRESFADYYSFLEEADVVFALHRLSDGAEAAASDDVLTTSQREALCLAAECGFFDVPRETTLGELAATLGISDQAVSERIRRGQSRLIEEYLS